MNKGRELTIEEIKNLKNFSKVWMDYLDKEEFDLEYCDTLHINTYYSEYSEFGDYDGNTFKMAELINYIEEGQIKVYETEGTKISEIKPMTNYERIRSMTIEEMAENRIKYIETDDCYVGDWSGNREYEDYIYISTKDYVYDRSEAIAKEINWLMQEVE